MSADRHVDGVAQEPAFQRDVRDNIKYAEEAVNGKEPDAPRRATFSSGAVRSEKAPPWFMLPWDALRVVLERFNIGAFKKGYGVHNWKRAIGTGDLDFIRQLFDHTMNHLLLFVINVGTWHVDRDPKSPYKDETPMDHLGAAGWGILTLISYTLFDRQNVMKAFDQWPAAWFIGPEITHTLPVNGFTIKDNQWVPKNVIERDGEEQGNE